MGTMLIDPPDTTPSFLPSDDERREVREIVQRLRSNRLRDWFCAACRRELREDELVMGEDGSLICYCGGKAGRYFED